MKPTTNFLTDEIGLLNQMVYDSVERFGTDNWVLCDTGVMGNDKYGYFIVFFNLFVMPSKLGKQK